MKEFFKKYLNDEIKLDKKIFIGLICLIIVSAGIFGFVYEFFFYFLNSGMKKFYYRGSNFLPWINIYATGALFIYFLTRKHKKQPLKVFLYSTVICGIIEYIGGYILYHFGNGFRCWDYNTEILNFLNINGFVCLRSVVFFGISSLILMYIMIPGIIYLSTKMSKKAFFILAISLCSIFLIDEIYNLVIARIFDLQRASDIYKKIGFIYMEFK